MAAVAVDQSASGHHPSSAGDVPQGPLARLQHAIEHAEHFLPAQGPITVFIHHNTLHAFEHLSFDEGVQQGAKLFGCQPYLSEDRYREMLGRGRIRIQDLSAVLIEDLGDRADVLLGFMGTRFQLRLKMLEYPVQTAPPAELRWFVAETDALRRFRLDAPPEVRRRFIDETRHLVMRDLRNGDSSAGSSRDRSTRHLKQAVAGLIDQFGRASIERWSDDTWEAFVLQSLWRVCRDGVHGLQPPPAADPAGSRHRDLLWEATGVDSDLLVNEVLIRFCAAFLDQGFSHWPLPQREQGFFRSFSALHRQASGPPELWLRSLRAELARLEAAQLGPLESILESLELLGVPESEWETFLTTTLLALRGWGGMVRQVEVRGDSVAHAIPAGSLVEFLTVRLVLDRLALSYVARKSLGHRGPLHELRSAARAASPKHETANVNQRAFQVFQLAQVLGWLPVDLARLSKEEWSRLITEIETFPAVERRRVFHAAFERRYRVQSLDAVGAHAGTTTAPTEVPRFQMVCCLDEREESFRRHIEELAPGAQTFGVAGFFNIPIYYRGAAEAHFVPLCPIVIKPQHWVEEDVAYTLEDAHHRRAQARRALGMASHQFHMGSRNFAGGALFAAGLGALATIPLVARVLFPRLTARIRRSAGRWVQPPSHTHLQLERKDPTPGPEAGQLGLMLDEMANMAERFLRDIGLTSGFSRLLLLLGHGSSSLNNPHNSAYNCGACGGGAGGPNARAMAQILNDPRVRELLARRGLTLSSDTFAVGGLHNTCNDSVTYLDLERLPKSHRQEFEEARAVLEDACDRNAHERCRRFQSAPLTMSFPAARRHVEARSEDLSQTRPECGHATNALCIVGRRSRTRGLFLDRRAFLTSYDPTQDDADRSILTRILQAVFPVCGGINLEYYFSYVDNPGFGCGTKLPHNVTSLLGVMDGAGSDLRTGLPWQMVEIHDPVRLLIITETTPAAMLQIMDRNPGIGRLCRNGWVQLATLAPDSSQVHFFNRERFELYRPEATELPAIASSVDWYRGWREHLGFAVIQR